MCQIWTKRAMDLAQGCFILLLSFSFRNLFTANGFKLVINTDIRIPYLEVSKTKVETCP